MSSSFRLAGNRLNGGFFYLSHPPSKSKSTSLTARVVCWASSISGLNPKRSFTTLKSGSCDQTVPFSLNSNFLQNPITSKSALSCNRSVSRLFTRMAATNPNVTPASQSGSKLYPSIEPFKTDMLQVDDIHTIYVEQCGNPEGKPVIFVHGGPGGGSDIEDRRLFDPKTYRIILFDQRGSGRSKPISCLEKNTTWDLVEDMEKIRKHLGINEKWGVFGGSWGSTLSLAYAQTHPDRVRWLALRGIFALRKAELNFFYQGPGTSFLFPEFWDEYVAQIPAEERGDMMGAYYKRLTSNDPSVRASSAQAWTKWEQATSRLYLDDKYLAKADKKEEGGWADVFARIECHYFVNEAFMRDGQLLEKQSIDKIRSIPGVIVQGRYDCVCPATTAWELHKQWPEAKFTMVPDAGHSIKEPGIESALISATDEFRSL